MTLEQIPEGLEERALERGTDPLAVAGGVVGVIAATVLVLLLPQLARAGGAARQVEGNVEPFEYIEARLLKYGEQKDPDQLPDRIVPPQATAPEEVIPLDREEEKPEPEPEKSPPKKRERQPDAVSDDKLREVFEKARAFAEVQDDFVPEGHPDGVPEGDVTDPALASMGATYGLRIKRIFLERWVVPTLLSEDQLAQLRAKVNVRVDIDMVIVAVEFLTKSGNRMFDDSVQNAVDRVRAEVRTLPAPPEAIAPRIFGGGINIKFHGKEASYE